MCKVKTQKKVDLERARAIEAGKDKTRRQKRKLAVQEVEEECIK